jgi:hypothetical protein
MRANKMRELRDGADSFEGEMRGEVLIAEVDRVDEMGVERRFVLESGGEVIVVSARRVGIVSMEGGVGGVDG